MAIWTTDPAELARMNAGERGHNASGGESDPHIVQTQRGLRHTSPGRFRMRDKRCQTTREAPIAGINSCATVDSAHNPAAPLARHAV